MDSEQQYLFASKPSDEQRPDFQAIPPPGYRQCSKCKRILLTDDFYIRPNGYIHSHCKDCIQHGNRDRAASHENEQILMRKLESMGIPIVHGKHYALVKHVDLVAFGCVLIEAKQARIRSHGEFIFANTYIQRKRGWNADIVIFVCDREYTMTYHVFPADFPSFYDGQRLRKCIYVAGDEQNSRMNAARIRHQFMEHQDSFELIYEVLNNKIRALAKVEPKTIKYNRSEQLYLIE